jgi:hypothetical protein
MEERASILGSLFDKVKSLAKVSVDLIKLQAIDKSADVLSSLLYRILLVVVVLFLIGMANIGLALWIGSLMGMLYLGFLMVALFYLVLALVFYVGRNSLIKKPLRNIFIKQLLNLTKE